MADLAQALDAALEARYPIPDVKTPATQRRGLLARMNQLEKTHKGDGTDRQAAAAAGVSLRTWRGWRKGTTKPSAASLRKLEGSYVRRIQIPAAKRRINAQNPPNRVRVTATIKWTDSPRKNYNKTKHRTTTLEGMAGVMVRVIRAWATLGPTAAADALERGAADVYRADEIRFEGDNVEISFP